jgi:hypothetical protein
MGPVPHAPSLLALGLLFAAPAAAAEPTVLTLRPFFGVSALEFGLKTDAGAVKFKPNAPVKLGLGVSYGDYGAAAAFGIGSIKSEQTNGRTDALDWSLYWHGERVGIDAFFQSYQGLYAESVADACEQGMVGCQLAPDAAVRRLGVTATYVLDKAFSLPAAFSQSRRQTRSAGSWLLQTSLGRAEFLIDGHGMALSGGAVGGGYAYLWSWSDWFLAASLSAAFGPMYAEVEGDTGWKFGRHIVLKVGAGYNGPEGFGGLNAFADAPGVELEDQDLSWTTIAIEFHGGYRF